MKKVELGQGLSIVANLGIIVGLGLVALELNQNSELMRLQISQARADAAMAAQSNFFNSPYLPPIEVKIQQGQELTAEESVRYVDAFRAANRNQDNVLSQFDAGMLGNNTPRSVAAYVCVNIGSNPVRRGAWEFTKVGYTDRYVAFVEETLAGCE